MTQTNDTHQGGRSGSRYAYYPGCSLHASAQEYDASWRAICEHLGIELVELTENVKYAFAAEHSEKFGLG